ncbi:anthranilate synthase component I [Halolamina salifodinae]|uniref:Anthranilate synthase component 1 n=1 Tax=Halolamina salifodinae TaxID=1202767 RepID=A0A8T4GT20_9EURY|nr:anthranilate synthase component I [Halolamina salifodinae]MBP1986167.1 anthranilate synthase component 1 [Halolamina salifodinae]
MPEFDRSRSEFEGLLADTDGPAVARLTATLDVDTEPLSAYAALGDRSDHTFLLESAEKVASSDPAGAFAPADGHTTPGADDDADRHARFSFVGYDPEALVSVYPNRTEVEQLGPAARFLDGLDADAGEEVGACDGELDDPDTLDRLRLALPGVERVGFEAGDRQRLDGGLVGFLAYDAVYDLHLAEVGVERPDPVVPDAQFVLTTRTLAFDDREGSVELVFTPVVAEADDAGAVYDRLVAEAEAVAGDLAAAKAPETGGFDRQSADSGARDDYEEAVAEMQKHVLGGDVYQGVVSRSHEIAGDLDTLGLYASLREVNPSPYMYLLSFGDRSVVGASPETLVSVTGERVVSNPIAGTCARGASPVEDRRLAGELLADDKERAEHTMLVDLARNDIRQVSRQGSVRVEEFMNVLKYSHVQHIESTVTGRLHPDFDGFDATRAAFPAGTLTGAPKVRAMELLDDLEVNPRGVYGGGVGYFSWTGDADTAIVIRTATVDHGEGDAPDEVRVRAGAGVVADSDPASEFEETEQKVRGVLDALERIEGGAQ